jgi:hypothetical protein
MVGGGVPSEQELKKLRKAEVPTSTSEETGFAPGAANCTGHDGGGGADAAGTGSVESVEKSGAGGSEEGGESKFLSRDEFVAEECFAAVTTVSLATIDSQGAADVCEWDSETFELIVPATNVTGDGGLAAGGGSAEGKGEGEAAAAAAGEDDDTWLTPATASKQAEGVSGAVMLVQAHQHEEYARQKKLRCGSCTRPLLSKEDLALRECTRCRGQR